MAGTLIAMNILVGSVVAATIAVIAYSISITNLVIKENRLYKKLLEFYGTLDKQEFLTLVAELQSKSITIEKEVNNG